MLELLLALVALLYSCVGHAGASGYLAALTLWGLETDRVKPAALALNILVATIGTVQFGRARLVPWHLVPLFALPAIPAAFCGGYVAKGLPDLYYKPLLGLTLLFAAWRLAFGKPVGLDRTRQVPARGVIAVGAGIGFLSGLTSTGGGIFLSPLMLLLGWAEVRQTAGLSVVFILATSISGLVGQLRAGAVMPAELPGWLLAVGLGGLLGSQLGSRRLGGPTLKKLLAGVLVVAAGKLLMILGEPLRELFASPS